MDKEFNQLYYESKAWEQSRWLGYRCLKPPTDMMVQQEIIMETKPDVIIETGTYEGGSAVFYASIFQLMGTEIGHVITIDKKVWRTGEAGDGFISQGWLIDRVTSYTGSSTDPTIIRHVVEHLGAIYGIHRRSPKIMVVLDSNHNKRHVLKELELYSSFVTPGCYLIVEDTIISPDVAPHSYPGPAEAVDTYMKKAGGAFIVDTSREKHMLSFHKGGYLLRTNISLPKL